MNTVDQYAKLKDAISVLQDHANSLRDDLLRPGVPLYSNQYEVVVERRTRRVLKTELLPPEILNDPRFWHESDSEEVLVRQLDVAGAMPLRSPSERFDPFRYRC